MKVVCNLFNTLLKPPLAKGRSKGVRTTFILEYIQIL